jgi:CRISPR-associated protein Cmr5
VSSQIRQANGRDLLDWVIKDAMTNDYRRATAEAIAFLGWAKRFAEAELPSGGER